MSENAEDNAPDAGVLDRVRLPGRLLTGVGFVNVIMGLMLLQTGIQIGRMTPAEFRADQREKTQRMAELGIRFDEDFVEELANRQDFYSRAYLGWGVLALVGAFFATYGGYNLRTLNSYRVALAGAIMAILPPTSPTSCCGVGVIVGIWASVLLLRSDIRSAFATNEIEMES